LTSTLLEVSYSMLADLSGFVERQSRKHFSAEKSKLKRRTL